MKRLSIASTRAAAFGVCTAVLVWCAWRAVVLPVSAGEAALYNHLVRVPAIEAAFQPDAWRGLVYAVTARRTVGLFRLSEFTMRMPSLLSAVLYLWLVFRLSKNSLWILGLAVLPAVTSCFNTAQGGGLASAFCLGALSTRNRNVAGLALGMALAAAPDWWWMPAAVGVGMLVVSRDWVRWVEQVAITATAAAFIVLLIPLVHAGDTGPLPPHSPEEVRAAIETLRGSAGEGAVSVAVSPDLTELFLFYRAKYRARGWEVLPPSAPAAGYFLLSSTEEHPGRVLFRGASLGLFQAAR